jgi:transposase-like protein
VQKSERMTRELEKKLSRLSSWDVDRFTIKQNGKWITVYSERHGLLSAIRTSTNLEQAELEEVALRRAARRFAYLRSTGGAAQ